MGRTELLNTKASPREAEKAANPRPPHTMCHTPHWASAGRVAFLYFVFLKRRKCIRGHFLAFLASAVVLRNGFSKGIRRHPRVRWQICESKWLLFRTLPCDVAASQKSQGLVTIHPDLNFPPRNLLSKLISFETWCVLGPSFVWGYLSSANVCNFIHDRGVRDSIEISWLRYHVKTRARRGSSFSQLGLEPNHTGCTPQSLFFLEESCRVKRSDTQTFSNFSNDFKRVLKL